MNQINTKNIEDINIFDFFLILWKRKLTIIATTTIAAILSVIFSLSLPNIYTSSTLLIQSDANQSLASNFSGLSSLASLSNIPDLRSPGENKSKEAMARIRSYNFFENQFLPNIKLENLMAARKWEPELDVIKYNNDFIKETNTWVRAVKFPYKPKPSNQEAFKVYSEIINLYEDQKTFFVTLSVEHISPKVASAWNKIIFNEINAYMRQIDKSIAEESIKFLKDTSLNNNIADIDNYISSLLKEQLQNLMFTESRKDYIYSYIEAPYIPEKKSKPSRALICIMGTFLGGLIGVLSALILNFKETWKLN